VPSDYQPVKTVTYLYTDQPIYRPARPMYLRGIVRLQDDVTFNVPQNEPIQVTIFDPEGREVYSQALTLNEYGAFSAQYVLPQETPLGSYSVRTRFRGQEGFLSFTVAEFRPPVLVRRRRERRRCAVESRGGRRLLRQSTRSAPAVRR
jgi:uncharacterized protein YfaS (alpha-2-macroglobulin family)